MNDTLREYLSYPTFIIPLLRVKKIIKPEYIKWGSDEQYFLCYKSPNRKSNNLIIYIHGGGWEKGTPETFHFIGQRFALEGYDCVMPSYRKTPKHKFDEICSDIFEGYVAIQDFLTQNQLDYQGEIIVGSSAGAHLGALLCHDSQRQGTYDINIQRFSGFIGLAGPYYYDFPHTRALNKLLSRLFGTKDTNKMKEGEPYSFLQQRNKTRMLIIHSRHDGVVNFDQASLFVDKAIAMNIPVELYEVKERRNTHSNYSVGIFLRDREKSQTIDKLLDWLEDCD